MKPHSLEIKKPLWIALSDLFLDTELSENDLICLAKKIKESLLPIEDVKEILMEEVLPVCIPNMKIVAGEWEAFNEDWLVDSIQNLTRPNALQRMMHKKDFRFIKDDWNKIIIKLKA